MKNIVITILVLIVLGFAGYTFYNQAQPDYSYQPSATAPVLNTPDNSFVTRPATVVDETDETKDWKTYKNEKYGFSFKYPENFKITENSPSQPSVYGITISGGNINNPSATLYVNTTFDGLFYTAKYLRWQLTVSKNTSLIVSEEKWVSPDMETEGEEASDRQLVEASFNHKNDKFVWKAHLPQDNLDYHIDWFRKIISTFRFMR
ncbi:MAG: hypothetical protein AAB364_00190 [Patescibacteria group bacterium]